MLHPGLYEQVINNALTGELAEIPEARKSVAPIDKAEASKVLAQYLADVVQKGLDNVLDNGGDISAQIGLTNQIVDLIQNTTKEADFAALGVDQRAEQLLALLREADPRLAVGKTAADIERPETSIAQSSLFTGAVHEPQMFTELKKEIVSADRIDMLVSFIKWSGLRLIMDKLREFTQNGGELRIITTSYMGATDVKAIEELRQLPNTHIKVSYNTKTTRLHAKAYVIEYIVRKIGVPLTQVKPPKTAIERCINQVARSRVVLQGTNGEKTVVSRSEGLTAAQQEEIQRIQSDRFDTSGSYIAAISEDTQATVKYNVKKGSIGIFKHLPAPVLFNWSQSAIEIILEEIENLKGRPAKEIFKELGLDIKWSYLYNEEDKIAAEWFLSNAISCLGSAEGAMYEIPEHVKPVLRKPQLFTVIPRIYCEQCGSYEIPYCAECGKPMECDENGRLHCSCGAPFHVQCFEGHRACRVENWYIPTSRMYTMINQNIHAAFKQDTADLVMCIMGSALYIAQPCIVRTEGVEVFFNQIDCFSCLPATAKENTKKYAVYLGEKCDGTCSNAKIGRCIADSSMACLPKAFYTLLPGFRPQPHKGLEYGDVAAQINVGSCAYEMKGIIKKNTMNSGRTSKSVDVLLNTHLLSTSKAGEEIIRQFVEQGLVDNRVDLIAVIAPQYFDNSFKGTLRFLAKLGGKKVMFIELDDVARLIEGNSAIDV